MTSKERNTGRPARVKCDETIWVSTIFLLTSAWFESLSYFLHKFWPDCNSSVLQLVTISGRSLLQVAPISWQNDKIPPNMLHKFTWDNLCYEIWQIFTTLLDVISCLSLSNSATMWRVSRLWCLMGILVLVHSSAVGSSFPRAWCFIPCQDRSQILSTLQPTPPLIKPLLHLSWACYAQIRGPTPSFAPATYLPAAAGLKILKMPSPLNPSLMHLFFPPQADSCRRGHPKKWSIF